MQVSTAILGLFIVLVFLYLRRVSKCIFLLSSSELQFYSRAFHLLCKVERIYH